jgi:hypothetical protein
MTLTSTSGGHSVGIVRLQNVETLHGGFCSREVVRPEEWRREDCLMRSPHSKGRMERTIVPTVRSTCAAQSVGVSHPFVVAYVNLMNTAWDSIVA